MRDNFAAKERSLQLDQKKMNDFRTNADV